MTVADKVKLNEEQIGAAGTLHSALKQWQLTDSALGRLRMALPGFGPEECLLKVVAVNALYGTNVLALGRAASHVEEVLASADVGARAGELVESLANIPTTPTGQPRRYISFASKFAHFFISPERFPIYDSYAERMLRLHLGASALRDPGRPYQAFIENLRALMREYDVKSSYRELDRYLWLAGQYRAYVNGARQLNAELLHVFVSPSTEQRALLRTVRGEP